MQERATDFEAPLKIRAFTVYFLSNQGTDYKFILSFLQSYFHAKILRYRMQNSIHQA